MSHPRNASEFLKDKTRAAWHDDTLWMVRQKRDTAASQVPEWENLRDLASRIKDHTLSKLAVYLDLFASKAEENGIIVHWAEDAAAHNEHVLRILRLHKCHTVVKSKSILTEECGLNPFLEKNGIEVTDTDLGERIIQYLNQPPSHIVMPAIHLKKEDISNIFHVKLKTEKGNFDPVYLTAAARKDLRARFLSAKVAITGVNFGIAETGEFVVCTNEGNADMGVHLANVHIACMGIEKLIPEKKHLGVFLRLLARSATGQSVTNYTSHFGKPEPGKELHLVIVDNGRAKQLSREKFRASLKCIRCGACMNTCPIYRNSGGLSYQSTVPGPIGSILSPGLDIRKYSSLPFASTLCGSCSDVCPVKINIHEQLYEWRQEIRRNEGVNTRSAGMTVSNEVFSRPAWYRLAGKIMRRMLSRGRAFLPLTPLGTWLKKRELPDPPESSFKEWYKKNRNGGSPE